MSSDSYFVKGKMHSICQDYALHGSFIGGEYVVISDGCSSSNYSEIGAQILCHVASQEIIECNKGELFKLLSVKALSSILTYKIRIRADRIRYMYGLPRSALEATLFMVIKSDRGFIILGWGDGVMIVNFSNGKGEFDQVFTDINFPLNAPFYLIDDPDVYRANFKERGILEPLVTYTLYMFSKKKSLREEVTHSFNTPFMYEITSENALNKNIVSVSICSDGISSYVDKNKNKVELGEIVPELVNYKNNTGEFVKKRMFFFNKKMKAKGYDHYDDVSCGTIYLSQNQKIE